VTYTVTVTNNGPSTATGVTVTDSPGGGLSGLASAGCSGSPLVCPVGSLAPLASATLTVTAIVQAGLPAGTTVSNTATVSAATADPVPDNDSATAAILTSAPQADLAVSKTGPATVVPGETVSYVVSVTNNGPSTATGVFLTDTQGVVLTGASSPGCSGSPLVCLVGSIAVGDRASFTVTATVDPTLPTGSSVTNTVSVTATTADPVPGNDSATATATTAQPSADLAATKTGPATVTPGVAYPYTVTVTNNGPSTATAVTLTDTLPPGVSLSAASGATCAGSPAVCDLGPVSPGTSVTVTLDVLPTASLVPGTVLANTATVSSAAADPVSTNDTATATSDTGPRSPNVTLTKTTPATMTAGATTTYTITATNAGPSDATVVVATDALDPHLSFVSSTPAGCTASAGSVTCALGTVPAGGSQSVTLTLLVASDTPAGTVIANGAVATSPDQADIPPAPLTPGPPVQLSADLAVTKTGPGTVIAGAPFDYAITVTNNGPSDAAGGVTGVDTLPLGIELLSTNGAACAGAPLHCDLGVIPAGAAVTVIVAVRFAPDLPTGATHTNTVTVSSPTPDPESANNSASATTVVGPASADLALSKTGPASPAPGTVVAYQLTYTNNGPSVAAAASIVDTLPAELTFLASDPPGCTAAGQVVTCPGRGGEHGRLGDRHGDRDPGQRHGRRRDPDQRRVHQRRHRRPDARQQQRRGDGHRRCAERQPEPHQERTGDRHPRCTVRLRPDRQEPRPVGRRGRHAHRRRRHRRDGRLGHRRHVHPVAAVVQPRHAGGRDDHHGHRARHAGREPGRPDRADEHGAAELTDPGPPHPPVAPPRRAPRWVRPARICRSPRPGPPRPRPASRPPTP
jgi:uncharacterized repeat protein (TIGR01451 family)